MSESKGIAYESKENQSKCIAITKAGKPCDRAQTYDKYCDNHSTKKFIAACAKNITPAALNLLVKLLDPVYRNADNKYTKIVTSFQSQFKPKGRIKNMIVYMKARKWSRFESIDYFNVNRCFCQDYIQYGCFKENLIGENFFLIKTSLCLTHIEDSEISNISKNFTFCNIFSFIKYEYLPTIYAKYDERILIATGYQNKLNYIQDLYKEMVKSLQRYDDKILLVFFIKLDLIESKLFKLQINVIKICSEMTQNYIANDILEYVLTPILKIGEVNQNLSLVLNAIKDIETRDKIYILMTNSNIKYISNISNQHKINPKNIIYCVLEFCRNRYQEKLVFNIANELYLNTIIDESISKLINMK